MYHHHNWIWNLAINVLNVLLNYLPIFFILFALIAILEDVGYMPRMAFILDRVFRKFGLQWTKTMIYSQGAWWRRACNSWRYNSKRILMKELEQQSFTILCRTVLAKVLILYTALGAFLKEHMSLVMFYISTYYDFYSSYNRKSFNYDTLKQERLPHL